MAGCYKRFSLEGGSERHLSSSLLSPYYHLELEPDSACAIKTLEEKPAVVTCSPVPCAWHVTGSAPERVMTTKMGV